MAFSDYKNISQVQKRFGIRYKEEDFIVVQEDVGPSAGFVEEFEFNTEHLDIYTSEASRSETVIFPMLREVYKKDTGISDPKNLSKYEYVEINPK